MTVLRTLLAVLAWIALPGVAVAALACRRDGDDDTGERFLGLALVAGSAVWLLGAELLARADALREGPVVAIGIGLAVASVVVLVGPGRSGLRVVVRSGGGVSVLIAAAVSLVGALPLLGQLVTNRDSFAQPTPWYYWQQVRDTVAVHGVPAWSYEWAQRVPFLDDYGAFVSGTGLLAVAGHGSTDGMAAGQSVEALTIVFSGMALFLLARAWGATRFAAAGAVLAFFALDIYVAKLSSFRPEASAYALAFLAAYFARTWLDRRRAVDLAAAGLALLALGQEHGIVWLLALCLVGATVLAGSRLGDGVRELLVRVGLLGGAVLAAWVAGGLVFGGNLGGVSKLGGLPEVVDGTDPTWLFQSQTVVPLLTGGPPSTATITRLSLERGLLGLGWQWHAVAAVAVAVALVVGALRGDDRRRALAARCLVFVLSTYAAVFVIAVWFTESWETYVPRRTGYGRLLPLAIVLLPIAAAVAVSIPARARLRSVAAGALVALAGVVLVHGLSQVDAYADQRPSAARLSALKGVKLPRGSVVLANSYTEGFLRVVLGVPGVIEGRAPYTESRLLTRANRLVTDARSFFAAPAAAARVPGATHGRAKTTHVLVVDDAGWNLGTPYVFPTDVAGLDRRRDLRLVQIGDGYRLYRVVTPSGVSTGASGASTPVPAPG